MSDDPYVYPGLNVLRNKLDIRDSDRFDYHEREFSTQRARMGVPTVHFDLNHLRSIHHHLFQDIYDWAGQIRTLEISKGGSQFVFRQYIENGMADVHRRIVADRYLCGLDVKSFSDKAGPIMGDINYVHPFREGNCRTQLLYLQQLARHAGHGLDLRKIDRIEWMEASKRAQMAEYTPMSRCILAALKDKDE